MITVHWIPGTEWKSLAKDAHLAVFGELAPETQERMDFALLAVEEKSQDILSYVTCRELDPTTVYWGYGGAFPPAAGTTKAWRAYQAMTEKCATRYRTIFTLIQNTNAAMLKMAAKIGYQIIGIRHVDGATMLEHVLQVGV